MSRFRLLRRALSLVLGAVFLTLLFYSGPREVLTARWAADWPRWAFGKHPGVTVLGWISGGLLIVGGVGLAVRCTVLFGRKGSGTPVPTDPPERLVVSGPFRWTRNPMYLAYTLILVGEALAVGHTALLLYAAVCAGAFHLITLGEEILLLRRFGGAYERFARQVPRWIGPRRRAAREPADDG